MHLASGIRHPVSGIRYLVSGIWYLVAQVAVQLKVKMEVTTR